MKLYHNLSETDSFKEQVNYSGRPAPVHEEFLETVLYYTIIKGFKHYSSKTIQEKPHLVIFGH